METPQSFARSGQQEGIFRTSTPSPDLRKRILLRTVSVVSPRTASSPKGDRRDNNQSMLKMTVQDKKVRQERSYHTLSQVKLRLFPTGRQPWRQVPGLEYRVEDEEEGGEEEDIEAVEAEDEVEEEKRRVRNDKYEMDSFTCENGYLSEEERFETPKAVRTEKRLELAKLNAASERRKARHRLEELKGPELLGVLFNTHKGAVRPVFKKWGGIVFSSTPIQTGISVEQDLLRQAIQGLVSGTENCPCPDLDLQSLPPLRLQGPGYSSETVLPPLRLQGPGYSSETVLPPPQLNLDTLPGAAPDLQLAMAPEAAELKLPHAQAAPAPADCSDGYGVKYKIKYALKNRIIKLLDQRSSPPPTPRSVMKVLELELDPTLLTSNKDLTWKYVNKYLYKFITNKDYGV